jgi:hypothetical protein
MSYALWAGKPVFYSQQAQEIFLFSTVSNWLWGLPSLKSSFPGGKVLHGVPRSTTVELYLHFQIHCHGTLLN